MKILGFIMAVMVVLVFVLIFILICYARALKKVKKELRDTKIACADLLKLNSKMQKINEKYDNIPSVTTAQDALDVLSGGKK